MTKIIFVCHGNICRSAMAEFILKNIVVKRHLDLSVSSAAVSNEEIGNDLYPPAKRKLEEHHIPYARHFAHRITQKEMDENDYVICMDRSNLSILSRIVDDPDHKARMLLNRDVADPWYTGDFETTYQDLVKGIELMLEEIYGN